MHNLVWTDIDFGRSELLSAPAAALRMMICTSILALAAGRPGSDRCGTGPAPLAPALVICAPSAAEAGALNVRGTVDDETDYVSIELGWASDLRPRVHLIALVDTSTKEWSASLPVASLTGVIGANGGYAVAVRAHLAGCAEDGGAFAFSNLTWASACVASASATAHDADALATAAARHLDTNRGSASATKPKTRWLEVFRMSEEGRMLPDFLDNHDSGDLGGDGVATSLFLGMPSSQRSQLARQAVASSGLSRGGLPGKIQRRLFGPWLSGAPNALRSGSAGDSSIGNVGGGDGGTAGGTLSAANRGNTGESSHIGTTDTAEVDVSASPFPPTIWTRYCVEILETSVPNTTTTSFGGLPMSSPFSDYRSTNPWDLITQLPPLSEYYWTHAALTTPGSEYGSWCDLLPDRAIGQLSRQNILNAYCVSSLYIVYIRI